MLILIVFLYGIMLTPKQRLGTNVLYLYHDIKYLN